MRVPIERATRGLTVLALGAAVAACGGGQEAAVDEGAAGAPAAATAAAAEERVFERDEIRGDGCVLMSAEDVAAEAGVDVAEVTENPALDCLFAWPGGSAVVNTSLHASVERARQHYASFTEDVTADEMRQGKEDLQARLDEQAAEGEISEGDAAIGGALAGAMPEGDVVHRRIDGLGNEASMDERGAVTVRVGNLTLELAAKNRGEDDIDPELTEALARRVVGRLAGA